jgi:hypothetical protein
MTTTTAPITVQADGTVDVAGNLFKLDALIEGYSSILEQAKQQLEALDITEHQLEQIGRRASSNIDYYRLARATATELGTNSECENSLRLISEYVVRKLDNDHIRGLIRSELGDVVKDQFAEIKRHIDLRFETLISNEQAEARTEARASTRMFEELFRSVFGQEIKDQIKRQANELAEDWQKRRAELDQQQAEG